MSDQKVLTASEAVQELISRLDVDAVGVASLSDLKGSKLEEAALRLLPETQSIAVIEMEIYSEILDNTRVGREMGAASLNELMDRNSEFLSGRLTRAAYDVAKASRNHGFKALPLPAAGCPMDARFLKAVFSYKHAAEAAGLGSIGRSSLLLTPDFGPRVRLAVCLTELPLEPRKITVFDVCGGCEICIDNCPSGALQMPQADESYTINKFACTAFRKASGGCSECMRLCPAGR